jgi:RNA polymerase sigma factor (sigma-70 family)
MRSIVTPLLRVLPRFTQRWTRTASPGPACGNVPEPVRAVSAYGDYTEEQKPRTTDTSSSALNVLAPAALYRTVDDYERALEDLYRSRYAKFEAVLVTMTRDREAARDAVQEAFAIALARRRQFRGEGTLEGWVWKIALRLAAGRPRSLTSTHLSRLEPTLSESTLDADLVEALRELSPRRRLFVFLRYYADLSYAEIAQACGVSRGTVAAALAQARSELASSIASEQTTGGLVS